MIWLRLLIAFTWNVLVKDVIAHDNELANKADQSPFEDQLSFFKTLASGSLSQSYLDIIFKEEDSTCRTPSAVCELYGYKYENYHCLSDDGYTTQLTRIVNPHNLERNYKRPPVVLYGGVTVSSAAFIMASPPQKDGISSNRSLGFMLSSMGYDVWLVPSRGVDELNSASNGSTKDFWDFSFDEIIQYELKNQLDLVMKVSRYHRITLVPYSTGALITMTFLAAHSDYTYDHVDSLIALAPVVYANPWSLYLRFGPRRHMVYPVEPVISKTEKKVRLTLGILCSHELFRNSFCRLLNDLIFGHCEEEKTLVEFSLIDHILRPVSAKSMSHLAQIAENGQIRRYSSGFFEDRSKYGDSKPTAYATLKEGLWSLIDQERITIIAGDCDALADMGSIKRLSSELRVEEKLKIIHNYNHLDVIAAWDVDERVNEFVLEALESRNRDIHKTHEIEHSY